MNIELFQILNIIMAAIVGMAILKKLYKRSVSAFISIIGMAIFINLIYVGLLNAAMIVTVLFALVLVFRGTMKQECDTWIPQPRYTGRERRRCSHR